jgi:hypothetical protein
MSPVVVQKDARRLYDIYAHRMGRQEPWEWLTNLEQQAFEEIAALLEYGELQEMIEDALQILKGADLQGRISDMQRAYDDISDALSQARKALSI